VSFSGRVSNYLNLKLQTNQLLELAWYTTAFASFKLSNSGGREHLGARELFEVCEKLVLTKLAVICSYIVYSSSQVEIACSTPAE